MRDNECCARCMYCKELYIPPVRAFEDVSKGYVCVALTLMEKASPQWLGNDIENDRCEMFSDKEVGL